MITEKKSKPSRAKLVRLFMNINRAGKQTKAFWRSEEKWRNKWESEKPITSAEKSYGQYLRTMERIQGHAAGWLDGVRWARRQRKSNDRVSHSEPSAGTVKHNEET